VYASLVAALPQEAWPPAGRKCGQHSYTLQLECPEPTGRICVLPDA
jgi:hypothetical protein